MSEYIRELYYGSCLSVMLLDLVIALYEIIKINKEEDLMRILIT